MAPQCSLQLTSEISLSKSRKVVSFWSIQLKESNNGGRVGVNKQYWRDGEVSGGGGGKPLSEPADEASAERYEVGLEA